MTYEELLKRIDELEKENILLRRQLREQANERIASNDDLDANEDIEYEPVITSPVTTISSKSKNSSVSESKKDEKNFGSELRKRLFPWLKNDDSSIISNDLEDKDYQIEEKEEVDINQFTTSEEKDNDSKDEDLSTENTPVDLSGLSFVDITEEDAKNNSGNASDEDEEEIDINQFATINKKNSNSQREATPVDLSGFSFVDSTEDEENTNDIGGEDTSEEEFSGYVFADDETRKNEDEENNKKRRFSFFGKKKEKINYQPKHMRQTKKLERIRESKFFKKIKSIMNKKAVKVIAAVLVAPVAIGGIILASKLSNDENKNNSDNNVSYVMRDDSEVPSTTAANEFGVSVTDVTNAIDKNKTDKDMETQLNGDSKEDVASSVTSGSNEQNNNQEDSVQEYNAPESTNDEIEDNVQEYDAPESTNDEVKDNVQEYDAPESTNDEVEVDSNEYEDTKEDNVQEYNAPKSTNDEVEDNNSNDLNTDYTIADDGYSVEISYDIGDPVSFEGPYLYRTSVDAANDTNRYNPLNPLTDERVISLIRLVSPDGSEKITIDANNKEKKGQLEAQGWTVESYNVDDLTNGVTNEGWTPGKSLK